MNNKERLAVLKKVLGLKVEPEPKPVKKCFICHKTINDGICTTHPSWSIYCSDCVVGMKL